MEDMETTFQVKEENCLQSYEMVFKSHYKPLVLEAFFILKDEMEAEDLVQSFFAEAWERQLLQNINTSVKAYLHTSIRNRSLNLLEKRQNEKKKLDKYLYGKEEIVLDNQLERSESASMIKSILNELPKQRLEVVNLVYLEDKKYQEAADEMGISINSIKTHLKLAVKNLRARLNNLK